MGNTNSQLKATYQGSVTNGTLSIPNGYTSMFLVNDGSGDVTIVNNGTSETFTLKANEFIRDLDGYFFGNVCTVPSGTTLRYRYQI